MAKPVLYTIESPVLSRNCKVYQTKPGRPPE